MKPKNIIILISVITISCRDSNQGKLTADKNAVNEAGNQGPCSSQNRSDYLINSINSLFERNVKDESN